MNEFDPKAFDWATAWMTLNEASEYLGGMMSVITIRKRCVAGTLPFKCSRINGRWYVTRQSIEEYKSRITEQVTK